MISPQLLELICCPETKQPLQIAPPELVASINQRIAAGTVRTRGRQLVQELIQGGLVRADGKYLYPIRQDIPVLLTDEAIPVEGTGS